MSTWHLRTFFENNEQFQQSLQLWEFCRNSTAKTYAVPAFMTPYIEACVTAAQEGKDCPDFEDTRLEEEGVETVDEVIIRTGSQQDNGVEEVEWTCWSEILSAYYEWLKFQQEP
jgi:hypothetical protein